MTTTLSEQEMTKRAAKAYATGFITHCTVGLGKTKDESVGFYKKANALFQSQSERQERIRQAILNPA